jgi:hypothetical protein
MKISAGLVSLPTCGRKLRPRQSKKKSMLSQTKKRRRMPSKTLITARRRKRRRRQRPLSFPRLLPRASPDGRRTPKTTAFLLLPFFCACRMFRGMGGIPNSQWHNCTAVFFTTALHFDLCCLVFPSRHFSLFRTSTVVGLESV